MRPVDIAPEDLETVRRILREHVPGFEVRAFGSRVSWTARETSDLDLAVISDEPLDISSLVELKEDFTQSNLPFRVDVVDWSTVSEGFRKIIEDSSETLRRGFNDPASVAKTCASLKRKAELNRQTRETLEAILRTVLLDWFVDYGPTRAKSNGKSANLPERLWSLFPDRLVDSEIGDIPEEWQLKSLATIADCVDDVADPDEVDSDFPHIGLEHMPRDSFFVSEWKSAGEATGTKLKCKSGDFLFDNRETHFRNFGMTPVDGICSKDLMIVRPKAENYLAMMAALLSARKLIDLPDEKIMIETNTRAIWKFLSQRKFAIPPSSLIFEFRKFAQPIIDLIFGNVKECHLLNEVLHAISYETLPQSANFCDLAGNDAL